MRKYACLSPDGLYRFILTRSWDPELPALVFVMLNPSTADAEKDDPTIRKCIGFARRHGYGSIRVINLCAYRATSPKDLKAAGWPYHRFNHTQWKFELARLNRPEGARDRIVCAWGVNARNRREVDDFVTMAREYGIPLYALCRSMDGTPHHPLMLPYSREFEEFP